MEYQCLQLELREQVACVFLNRPAVLNALNEVLVAELAAVTDQISQDDRIRAVVIAGNGGNFAAGADISKMVDLAPLEARNFSFKDVFNKIADLDKPVVAAMAGYALGAGLELALVCDLRIAEEGARFGLPEINIGIMPGAGGTQRLPRLIGEAHAREMIYLGQTIDVQTALGYGLINRIVSAGRLLDEAMEIAAKLAARPPIALRMAKRVMNYGMNCDVKTGIEFEAIAWADLFSTEDQKEGMKAFLAKRKPGFKGR
ncbi:MAG: enoyl-CoA hydratase/isomerase family protein [Firmicutes bacterium]|nr:enoyl-CoA hydratase/isomerase family protein [Bacillota bacterium]